MKNMESIVYFERGGRKYPVFKIEDSKKQTLLYFSQFEGEHITIHENREGKRHLAYSSKNKAPSVWEKEIIEIAKDLGYRNPENHANYYHNRPIDIFQNGKMPIVSRLIDTWAFVVGWKNKYEKLATHKIESTEDQFYAEIIFSAEPVSDASMNIKTDRGYFVFHFRKEPFKRAPFVSP